MSNLIFIFKAYNPNKRTTYFQHKGYTDYIANSKYVLKNPNTTHGLFGVVKGFPNIQNEENIEPIINYIDELAKNKVPIYRGYISLREYDAERLGYYNQDKWKNLLENRLPSIAKKMNIKLEDIQYLGAVHIEEGHPHFQFFVWSKKQKINYFVKYKEINKLRNEFTNDVFREDLIPIYQEKDLAKKNIVDLLIDLKKDLKQTTGSIKYQYLMKYPDIINKLNNISNTIIDSSVQCKIEIEKYIKAKQKLEEFKYSNKEKLEQAMAKAKEEAQEEVIKLIGNQILDIERKWLNTSEPYTYIKYNNDSRDLTDRILTALYFLAENQNRLNRNYELNYKKQLSKQAKKELARSKRNASSFEWEDEI